MTEQEVDKVIRGFMLGGVKTETVYPPGERIRWFFDREVNQFCMKVQTQGDGYTQTYTEKEMRELLREQQHKYWSEVHANRIENNDETQPKRAKR